MVVIWSAGGSRFLTGPLLLGVLTRSPKAELGVPNAQPAKVAANNFCAQHQSGAAG